MEEKLEKLIIQTINESFKFIKHLNINNIINSNMIKLKKI